MSRPLITGTVALVLALLAAAPAGADVLDPDDCPDRPASQVFLPWLDPAYYVLARGGAFEGRMRGWDLAGGARTVRGNEPFHLRDADDQRSLSLPGAGASATSSANCVSLAHPTVRFVARSTGSPLAFLVVSAVVRDGAGVLRDLPIGVVSGALTRWHPTVPMALLNGLTASALEGATEIRFRFKVVGAGGAFQVDDLYIDPYRRG